MKKGTAFNVGPAGFIVTRYRLIETSPLTPPLSLTCLYSFFRLRKRLVRQLKSLDPVPLFPSFLKFAYSVQRVFPGGANVHGPGIGLLMISP